MSCILPTMYYRSQHCWELLHPFADHCQHARSHRLPSNTTVNSYERTTRYRAFVQRLTYLKKNQMDFIRLSAVKEWSWLTQSIILHTWCSFSLSSVYNSNLKISLFAKIQNPWNKIYEPGPASYWHSSPGGAAAGTQQIFKGRRPTPYLLYTIFHDFVYLLLKNSTPFHIPCLELCIPFNWRKCTVIK